MNRLLYIMFYFYLNNYPTRPNKLQLLDKVGCLVRFDYFSSQAYSLGLSVQVFKQIHQKMKSLNVYDV